MLLYAQSKNIMMKDLKGKTIEIKIKGINFSILKKKTLTLL